MKWLEKILPPTSTKKAAPAGWKAALAKNNLTHQEFCKLCTQAIQEIFGIANVEQPSLGEFKVKDKNGEPITIYLENTWRRCKDEPDERVEAVERLLRVFTSSADRPGQLPQRASIVPTIKDIEYFNEFQKNNPGKHPSDAPFVSEHFAGDLWIVYAIDSNEAIRTLMKEQLEQLNLELSQLKSLAVENLKRILPPVEQHGEGPVFMLTAGGDYVASLLLIDEIWEECKESVEGDIVAAVPSRDVLMFTGSNSQEGILALRKAVDGLSQTSAYLISTTMFRRHSDGWKAYS
jgi:uncharacterized protein YtpQ (UPF0354 family)